MLAEIELRRLNEERVLLQRKIQLLRKKYEYYDQFNFSDNLGDAISSLVREFEGKDCECKKIICEVPEHEELVSRHFRGRDHIVSKRFSKKEFPFVIIVEKECIDHFSNLSFSTFHDMKELLENSSLFFTSYVGVLDLPMFESVFPYLKEFFHLLNVWRSDTGRVTLDDEIINQALEQVLNHGLEFKNRAR